MSVLLGTAQRLPVSMAQGSLSGRSAARRYHVCLNPDVLDADPALLEIVRDAGVDTIWLAAFLYGYWPYSRERLSLWRTRIEKLGLSAQIVNVPLGHPGDSLGSMSGNIPLTPPKHWQQAISLDGHPFAGTSLHSPATTENMEAMRLLGAAGFKQVFLDDDFRLASSPGQIGGCFCELHKGEFMRLHGYSEAQWNELLSDIRSRALTPLLRAWVDFQCDQLTASFRAQQSAAREVQLGTMVMYLGAEKTGIRLTDYKKVPLRVGELMFDDASFAPVKGKTNELFSSLFHRRFVPPHLAYSETTAYPAGNLSARNMAAKLVVSLLSDVRHTMFMSGLTPFPRTHWQTLAPAMKQQSALHTRLSGHKPRGVFKHFWGESSRMVGDDNPYSLFLASGVPFEVSDEPGRDGWTFLSDFDARAVASGQLHSRGTTFIARAEAKNAQANSPIRAIAEDLPSLFALKRELLPQLHQVPVVEEELPVVCAWYPTAHAVLLWNLSEQPQTFTLRFKSTRRQINVSGLDAALVSDVR